MNSKTTIIFVHGMMLAGDVWGPQQDWCRKNKINCVSLTLPGHGPRRDDDISLDKMVHEIVVSAEQFDKVILVGHSFGAYLCCLAAQQLKNLESVVLINPLLEIKQMRFLSLFSIKITKILQKILGVKKSGNYSKGTKWFWRWGIYPYCLLHNSAQIVDDIFAQIKKRGKVFLPRRIKSIIILSRKDELIRRTQVKNSTTILISGHMLARLAPETVNDFLGQILLH